MGEPSPDPRAALGAAEAPARGYQVGLSLRLPRDRASVGVIRHVTRCALDEVGVRPDISDDIELAVSEASANVLIHAGPGDSYDVTVTIDPEVCAIRVVDVGRGFDFRDLTFDMSDTDAEHGRGMALMHALMDQVRCVSEPERGTIVHLVKRLVFDESSAKRLLLGDLDPREP